MVDSVVKIDKELEKKISELIKKNKFVFSSKKQVVNLAIIEFLKSFSWKEKQNRRIKKNQRQELSKNNKKREK